MLASIFSFSSQESLQDVEIDYRVENQAKFLLKTQQAPAFHWFSSQDGLEKLLEKSDISSANDQPERTNDILDLVSRKSEESRKADEGEKLLDGNASLLSPPVHVGPSSPILNAQEFKESATSESINCDNANVPDLHAQEESINQSMSRIASKQELMVCDNAISQTAEDATTSCSAKVNTGDEKEKESDTFDQGIFSRPQETVSEPTLVHCSKNVVQSEKKETDESLEPVTIQSAPILPSERTVFRTDDNIVLVVEGEKIFVSKVLLSLHSEFFKAMFATDMKESQQSEIGKYDR